MLPIRSSWLTINFCCRAVFEPSLDMEIDDDYVLDNADLRILLQWSVYGGLTFEYRSLDYEPLEIEKF